MDARLDFSRFNNGCKKLYNMVCTTQGPATRRSGFQFIYDLNRLGLDVADGRVREIPFIFNEVQAYAMIFYVHTDGNVKLVFGTDDGLVIYPGTPAPYCPTVPVDTYAFDTAWAGDYDINFNISADTDITVIHNSVVDTELVLGVDYTVTINASVPHTLTMIQAPTADGIIEIYIKNQGAADEIVTLDLGPVVPKGHTEGAAGWDIEHFDWAQSADEMYIAQEGKNPHVIRRYSSYCWELVSLTFTDQPAEWSDTLGWPGVVVFHQQRLGFAATITKRQTVWLSQAGDFNHFGQSDVSIVDSDAISFTLDSGTQNKIVWMLSGKTLNIGTIGNEWTVTGATRTALTPSNILAQRQTNHGSEPIKPLLVGITTLFIEKYGRVVNEFVYDYTFDSYKTSDLSVLSQHVTEQYSITDWTYQQTPDNILWSVREDGALLGITYQREHEVVGWHQHTTDGDFKAITAIPGKARADEVWVIVKRLINGTDRYYVEKLAEKFTSDDSVDAQFVDSFVQVKDTAVTVISNLEHLEGESVSILADGATHPPLTVVGGQVELNKEHNECVIVGLPFESEVWPELPDIPATSGSSYSREQRIINIEVDFYNTLNCFIGRYSTEDGIEMDELPFRNEGHTTGKRVPLYTGIYHMNFLEGYSRTPYYFVKQVDPLPLTLRSAVDVIEVEE